jgi:predicted amidohydrolase YtcJ
MIVLTNGRIYAYDTATRGFVQHRSLLIDGARIAALDEEPAGIGARRIDLDGATVLPAFADCHVHLTDTGYFLGERDLSAVRSYADFVRRVEKIPNDGAIVLAGQYDESTWHDDAVPDAKPLELFHPAARALISRIDGHSCVVNRATLAWLDLPAETRGIERDADGQPTGKLFLEANWRAQAEFFFQIPLGVRRAAEKRAVELALARGALHLHAQLVGFQRDAYAGEIAALRTTPAKIYPKVCEPDPQLAQELELPFVGGDVFLDGSIGSRTAALAGPYSDGGGCGSLRFAEDALVGYFSAAEALGIAAGVHAIGDAAIEQCISAWERVLAGKPSPRGCRHFIEHFEIATREHIDACARMGIALSVQPQFDLLWGADGGMYEMRLGPERKHAMNAFASIDETGALLCGGDDSPVCDLDPLAGMQACVDHHEPSQRLSPHRALAMYTVNAARLAYAENATGNLAPGLAADLAVLDRDPLDGARFTDCRVVQIWRDGEPL